MKQILALIFSIFTSLHLSAADTHKTNHGIIEDVIQWFSNLTASTPNAPKQKRGLVCLIDQKNLPELANKFWDNLRSLNTHAKTRSVYTHVYMVTGAECRNDEHLKNVWKQAVEENDVVDYISMVHGGHQWIKDEHQVPTDSDKMGLFYSEGCGGGNGLEQFVKKYGALVAVGHNDEQGSPASASPYFSFKFLKHWCNGETLQSSINKSWDEFKQEVATPVDFIICKILVPNYKTVDDVITGTKVKYSYRDNLVNPATFTIFTSCQEMKRKFDDSFTEASVAQ